MLKHSPFSKRALNEGSLPSLPAAIPINLQTKRSRGDGRGKEGARTRQVMSKETARAHGVNPCRIHTASRSSVSGCSHPVPSDLQVSRNSHGFPLLQTTLLSDKFRAYTWARRDEANAGLTTMSKIYFHIWCRIPPKSYHLFLYPDTAKS